MATTKAVTVLWHPSASSRFRAGSFLQALEAQDDFHVVHVEHTSDTQKVVRELISLPGLIVAAGGDGTVNQTVSAMMQAREDGLEIQAELGLLPLGTGNDLSRSLQIPFNAQQAVETLLNGKTIPLDVLEVHSSEGRHWCANMITGGNTGKYLDTMTDELKNRWGAFCYFRGIIDVIQNLEAFEIEISSDGRPPESFSALNIFLANGKTSGGGMVISPDAALDDGRIDAIVVRDGEPKEIAQLTASYFLTDYQSHDLIEFCRASQVTLTSSPRCHSQLTATPSEPLR